MTLYTFDKHHDSKSLYNGEATKEQSPPADPHHSQPTRKWTHITRADGTMQWVYDGKPLYTFVKTKKTARTTDDGDGMKDVLHAATP
ncbi:hypothetical protein ABZV34_34400 [Streptomyces sp. NPDC005195]|uniref:hypothetical protein n=1 Tax=Streptomyces sp. NPDC005195 TaxID=3154561 RepID=UPI0033A91784